jgi:hypothetical protein
MAEVDACSFFLSVSLCGFNGYMHRHHAKTVHEICAGWRAYTAFQKHYPQPNKHDKYYYGE